MEKILSISLQYIEPLIVGSSGLLLALLPNTMVHPFLLVNNVQEATGCTDKANVQMIMFTYILQTLGIALVLYSIVEHILFKWISELHFWTTNRVKFLIFIFAVGDFLSLWSVRHTYLSLMGHGITVRSELYILTTLLGIICASNRFIYLIYILTRSSNNRVKSN
jgi:hypothetical protein